MPAVVAALRDPRLDGAARPPGPPVQRCGAPPIGSSAVKPSGRLFISWMGLASPLSLRPSTSGASEDAGAVGMSGCEGDSASVPGALFCHGGGGL